MEIVVTDTIFSYINTQGIQYGPLIHAIYGQGTTTAKFSNVKIDSTTYRELMSFVSLESYFVGNDITVKDNVFSA